MTLSPQQFSRFNVFHATFDSVGPHEWDDDAVVHVGTREAALDRATNLMHSGKRQGTPTLHEYRMARPTPFVWADPGVPSEVSEERLKTGGRWWHVNEDDPPERPLRYVNETEDSGSFSYVATPRHLTHVRSEPLSLESLRGRTPTYVEST